MAGSHRQDHSSGEKRKAAEMNRRVPVCVSCSTCTGMGLRRGDSPSGRRCDQSPAGGRTQQPQGRSLPQPLGSRQQQQQQFGPSQLVSPRGKVSLGMADTSKHPAQKLLFLLAREKEASLSSSDTSEKDSQASSPGSCVIPPCIRSVQCCGLLDTSWDTLHPCSLDLGKQSAFTTQRSSVFLPPSEACSLCFT